MHVSFELVSGGAEADDTGLRGGACDAMVLFTASDCPWLPTPTAEPPWLMLLDEPPAATLVAFEFEFEFAFAFALALDCVLL
jgi:hypothetical protein